MLRAPVHNLTSHLTPHAKRVIEIRHAERGKRRGSIDPVWKTLQPFIFRSWTRSQLRTITPWKSICRSPAITVYTPTSLPNNGVLGGSKCWILAEKLHNSLELRIYERERGRETTVLPFWQHNQRSRPYENEYKRTSGKIESRREGIHKAGR